MIALRDTDVWRAGQRGTLDGKVIMIDGGSDPASVHIRQGDTIHDCHAARDVARALGMHLFQSLRVRGDGRWVREAHGAWTLERFSIHGFDVLDDAPLSVVVARLRAIPGNGWRDVADPWSELMEWRA